MTKNNTRWDSLSMKDKHQIMKIFIGNGITNINQIKDYYNNYNRLDGESDTQSTNSTLDLSGISTTNNRGYDANRAALAYQYFREKGLREKQAAAIVGTLIEESGLNPYSKSNNGTYQGLAQWEKDRYRVPNYSGTPTQEDTTQLFYNQLNLIYDTLNNTSDKKSWTHGGTGSGYNTAKTAHDSFWNSNNTLEKINHALNWGYVRPKGKQNSVNNRYNVAKQVANKVNEQWNTIYDGPVIKYNKGGKINTYDEGSDLNTKNKKETEYVVPIRKYDLDRYTDEYLLKLFNDLAANNNKMDMSNIAAYGG